MPRVYSRHVLLCALGVSALLLLLYQGHRLREGPPWISAFEGVDKGSDSRFQERKPLRKDPLESLESQAASSYSGSSDTALNSSAKLPWFFRNGSSRTFSGTLGAQSLFPSPEGRQEDRIVKQLMYSEKQEAEEEEGKKKLKTILLYHGGWSGIQLGRRQFLKQQCPVNTCSLTTKKTGPVDAVLFKDHVPRKEDILRPPGQLWILYLLECPLHTQSFSEVTGVNWTATYRHDSEIVSPYEKWVYYDSRVKFKTQNRNYAAGKTKKVAWFVSNCYARNKRLEYAKELAKHIDVDIYGSCGTLKCPRRDEKKCFEMLSRNYKFYLAFENSNCVDYITEKFFVNGLMNDVLPIAMGARPEDYERAAPKNSFLHVDNFTSPAELAAHLLKLDQDDSLYNRYFQWKGTGEFIDTKFFCRLCSMLHAKDEVPHKTYGSRLETWWRGPDVCIQGSWRNLPPR
ncbi:unnamed protein product [Darwinula stevensoni]|uniref:Fucosyltransferase n=1 Tax=Darwinula stevensoni TaxID=69355 RepID=A0A7R8X4W8_9CRUS|nr:unnamed protein product [Darwinula stevensoni]CAG0880199.1 unnamed protein product [Darwinula stevensoni]